MNFRTLSKVIYLIFFISNICLLQNPNIVFAQESLIIEPAFQEIVMDASSTSKLFNVKITNNTSKDESFEVFAVEFVGNSHFGSLETIEIGKNILQQKPNFISFDSQQFVLQANQSRIVNMELNDRADLRPGGTYVAIIIRAITNNQTENQPILPAFASQLLIRKIDGEILNLSLKEIKNEQNIDIKIPTKINLEFENNGNIHLVPRGEIHVTDIFNRVIKQGIINDASTYVFPNSQKEIPVSLSNSRVSFPIMVLSVSAFGNAENVTYFSEYSYLYVSPIIIIIILIGICYLIIRKIKKKLKINLKEIK